MNEQLQSVLDRLVKAKEERGRLSKIAAASGISYRTIYGMMQGGQTPSASTVDKLAAYFKREDKKASKEAARHAGQ